MRSTFHGAMATCFAYGQTGSGKTFTMSGPVESDNTYRLLEKGLYGMVGEGRINSSIRCFSILLDPIELFFLFLCFVFFLFK